MTYKNLWQDDNVLRNAFSWATRNGLAPKFGTLPVGYYQQDQCAVIDTIEKACLQHGAPTDAIRMRNGRIEAKHDKRWVRVANVICGRILPA